MEYNNFTHNSKKRWLIVSVSVLAALSGGLLMTHNNSNVHASSLNSNQTGQQQIQTNHTYYEPELHVDQSMANDSPNIRRNSQQNVKPQINNLCGRILKNHVQSFRQNNSVSTHTLTSVNNSHLNVNNYKPEVTTDFEYKDINTGNIKLDDLIDGMAGDKINYSLYTQPNYNNLPKGFHFIKFGRHNNVFADDKTSAGNNVIWISPNGAINSSASSSSSQISGSTVNSKASASISPISDEIIPPERSANSSSESMSMSSSSESNVSSRSSIAKSTGVNSASNSQSISNAAASNQASNVVNNNSINSNSMNSVNSQAMSSSASRSVTSNSGMKPSNSITSGQINSNNNASESTVPMSSSNSSSDVPASEMSEESSNSVSSTTSVQSSSASLTPSFVPSFVSFSTSSTSSSSVNVNSSLNSWYASFMNSLADGHQSAGTSVSPMSSISASNSNSLNSIVNFGSLNNNQQSQVNSVISVHHTKPVARHVRTGRKLMNRMKTWRYHGHVYHTYRQYITPGDFRKGHYMYIRLIKDCNEYRSTHYIRSNRIRHLRKGMQLAIRRIVMITPHITRFQLMNGDYVTSNKYFAQVIK